MTQPPTLRELGLHNDLLYEFDGTMSPPKQEIARRQIEGAIRAFIAGRDPIVIQTLVAPASQILRDLNKEQPGSIAKILSDLAVEAGYSPGALWKEINDKSANYLKHAGKPDSIPSYDEITSGCVGSLCWVTWEYSIACGGLSSVMKAFLETWLGHKWMPTTFRRISCFVQFLLLDARTATRAAWLRAMLRILIWIRGSGSPA